jgi:3'(2'), 5'-bisphosphate nucleotidase|eukprot:g12051.t1 g12051   contig6:1116470-1117741(-)
MSTPNASERGIDATGYVPTGKPGSLERLCSVALRACELMTPLISSIYQEILSSINSEHDNNATIKSKVETVKQDNSTFTIADGLVQRLLINVLFDQVKFRAIVGEEEEDSCEDPAQQSWNLVQGLEVPRHIQPLVDSTKVNIESLAREHLPSDDVAYEQLSVFVDPIDGTREFATGHGEQCSICIGFADESGRAIAGLVYRPLTTPTPTFVAGSKAEKYAICHLNESSDVVKGGILTTNGSISPFMETLIYDEMQTKRIKSGGAGNKMLLLLENSIKRRNAEQMDGNDHQSSSMLYIQDRGVSRWDTCGAEACLEAFGGTLVKLTSVLESNSTLDQSDKYTYLASNTNLDFIPGSAFLTKYNSANGGINFKPNQKAVDVRDVKPYANTCGMVALGNEMNSADGLRYVTDAINRAARRDAPSLD